MQSVLPGSPFVSARARAGLERTPVAERSLRIDACRGIAALLVYWTHLGTSVRKPPFVLFGDMGVHVFFVVSGYLLYGPFARGLLARTRLPGAGTYCQRRFLRIGPPFLVALLATSVVRGVFAHDTPSIGLVLEHALFLTNLDFRPGVPASFRINPAFWSLAVEAQFYVALVALAHLGRAARRPELAALLPCGVCFALGPLARWVELGFTDEHAVFRYQTLPSFLDLFAWGMTIAVVEQLRPDWARIRGFPRSAALGLGACLILAAGNLRHALGCGWLDGDHRAFLVLFPLLLGGGVALLLGGWVHAAEHGRRSRALGALAAAGTISYSLYLYHIPLQIFLLRVLRPPCGPSFLPSGFVPGLVLLPPTLLVAFVAYWVVERPSLALARAIRERR